MDRRHMLTTSLAALGAAAIRSRPASAAAPADWTSLFDGKSMDSFVPIGNANWRVEDGSLFADSGDGFLVTKADYADFELRVEFWLEAKTNSGVFIRCTDPQSVTGKTAYEVNIWDTRPEQNYGTGAIVGLAAVNPMPHAAGKWSTYEISAKGDTFNVTLNGQKTVSDAHDAKFAKGRIALQHGKGVTDTSGIVKFRNITIRSL